MLYPSDSNEVYPGRYLTADYSEPGQVVEFTSSGHLLWRMGGFNQPSLALPLPDGDILLNDDFNHRVCVVDPATHRIVWQYGHTGVAGRGPGYLSDPDGVDLVPPDSLLVTHAATMGSVGGHGGPAGEGPIHTDLTLQNSRMPWTESSRPWPERLDAAERQLGIRGHVTVDEDKAGREIPDEPAPFLFVVGPCVGAEPELRAVGELDRRVDVRDAVEGGHRTEHLLAVHAHLRGDAGQHGRRVVEAGSLGRGAAAERPGSLGHRVGDEVLDVFALLLGGERADVGAVQHRVADGLGRHLFGEQALELVVDRVVHDEALGVDAGLAVVQQARGGAGFGGPAGPRTA